MTMLQPVPSDDRFDLDADTHYNKPPPRIVLVGEPGIGKTTFAASAPGVCIVPTEDGALGVNVPKLPRRGKCQSYDDVRRALDTLLRGKHGYKWVAIDTLNGVVDLCAQMVCERDFGGAWESRKGQEGFNAWGRGDKAVAQEMREVLDICDQLQQECNIGIILLAHEGLHKQGNALGADFQKIGASLNKHSWSLVCGWADQVGYASRDVRATTREGERQAKASMIGRERWVIFEGGPAIDAKARVGYEMPERILLGWDEYEQELGKDHLADLVTQALALYSEAEQNVAKLIDERLGEPASDKALRTLGKNKLEQLIGWLLHLRKQQTNREEK